jgi:hypothetical protein
MGFAPRLSSLPTTEWQPLRERALGHSASDGAFENFALLDWNIVVFYLAASAVGMVLGSLLGYHLKLKPR